MPRTGPDLLDWLSLRRSPDFARARVLGALIGFPLLVIIVVAVVATLVQFLGHVTGMAPLADGTARHEAIRNIGLVLAALIGAPFVMWRSWTAAQQVRVSEESLFNDKINAAAEDLGKRRQVTRAVLQDGKEVILTEWQDDRITRAAAIDRLEGLAEERPEVAPRIVRMLSNYLREMSRELPAAARPEDGSGKPKPHWARDLRPVRSDLEKAAQALGRLRTITPITFAIDLTGANLQGMDLEGLNFCYTRFKNARLEGANLGDAKLEGAYLRGARLQGTNILGAELQGAMFRAAEIDGTTTFQPETLCGAALRQFDLRSATTVDLSTLLLQTYGDASVLLPDNYPIPPHWNPLTQRTGNFRESWRAFQAKIGYTPPE